MVRRSVPASSRCVAHVCRLCLQRHSRHYVPFRTMSCNRSIALYFRPILSARADIVLASLHAHGEEGIYS